MSVATQLAEVNAAISALVTKRVKAYSIDGVSFTYHDLSELRLLKNDLLRQGRTSRNMMRPVDISGVYNT